MNSVTQTYRVVYDRYEEEEEEYDDDEVDEGYHLSFNYLRTDDITDPDEICAWREDWARHAHEYDIDIEVCEKPRLFRLSLNAGWHSLQYLAQFRDYKEAKRYRDEQLFLLTGKEPRRNGAKAIPVLFSTGALCILKDDVKRSKDVVEYLIIASIERFTFKFLPSHVK